MMTHIRIAQFHFGKINVFKWSPSNLCAKSFYYRKMSDLWYVTQLSYLNFAYIAFKLCWSDK